MYHYFYLLLFYFPSFLYYKNKILFMARINPSEININFTPEDSNIHREEENIILVAISGEKIFKKPLSEESLGKLCENLAEAFSFLSEDGVVDVDFKI